MNKKFTITALCIILAFSLLLGGCGKTTPSDGDGKGNVETPGTDKKVLTIGVSNDIISLDPQAHAHGSTDSLFQNIGSKLFKRDTDMGIIQDLATDYEIVDDTTWKFTMREDVLFSNGDKVTSADVKFSIERAAKDTSLVENNFFKGISGVEIIDEYSFYIKTEEAKPDLLSLLAKSGGDIMPSEYIEEHGMDEYVRNPILSGQYKLKEWVADSHYTLVPNDKYFGEAAYWDEVIHRIIPEPSTRVAELLTGGVDLIDNVPPNEWDRIESSDAGKMVKGETSRVFLLNVRLTEGNITSNPKVREAIELAIDKNLICDELLKGAGIPTRTRVANGVVGFNENLFGREKGDLYDLDKAKALLKEAGYEKGAKLTLTASRGRYLMDKEVGEMIASMLMQAGFEVDLEIVESSVLSEIWSARENKELFLIGLGDSQYDAAYPLIHYGDKDRVAGLTDYDNKETQEIYKKALSNMNLVERAEQMKEIQRIASEDRPHINIAQLNSVYGVANNIEFVPRLDESFELNVITLK